MLKELTGMPAGIQALEAVGTVTAADYERIFAPLVDQARRVGSRMRLLYSSDRASSASRRERCGRTRELGWATCGCSTTALS